VGLLLAASADVSLEDTAGLTALDYAQRREHAAIEKKLHEKQGMRQN
jgi:ankyrin repeat protein